VRGYGFLLGDDGHRYFVGKHAIRGHPIHLTVGEFVAFSIAPAEKGPEARDVYRVTPPGRDGQPASESRGTISQARRAQR
jgi:cold shock CspA family protein